jgi:hypothetical protein
MHFYYPNFHIFELSNFQINLMAKSTGETPLMQQHNAIKARYPDGDPVISGG